MKKIKHKCTIKKEYARKCQWHMFKSIYAFNRTLQLKNKSFTIAWTLQFDPLSQLHNFDKFSC